MYLFIFINDLPLDVNNFSTDLYADDTTIMVSIIERARGKTWKKWSSRILRKIFLLFDDFQDVKQGVLVVETLNMFFMMLNFEDCEILHRK